MTKDEINNEFKSIVGKLDDGEKYLHQILDKLRRLTQDDNFKSKLNQMDTEMMNRISNLGQIKAELKISKSSENNVLKTLNMELDNGIGDNNKFIAYATAQKMFGVMLLDYSYAANFAYILGKDNIKNKLSQVIESFKNADQTIKNQVEKELKEIRVKQIESSGSQSQEKKSQESQEKESKDKQSKDKDKDKVKDKLESAKKEFKKKVQTLVEKI